MIRSMTGFGSAEAEYIGQRLTAQIQSVNHRYCEISIRLPRNLGAFENTIRGILAKQFSRGKISFQLGWDGREEPGRQVRLDHDRVREYVEEIQQLQSDIGVEGSVDLPTLLGLPDVWVFDAELPDEDETLAVLEDLAIRSSNDLITMRTKEGEALATEFRLRLDRIDELVGEAEKKNDGRPAALKERMLTRLKPLLNGVDIDPSRLAQEVALLADRLDFTEECVRLKAHVSQFRSLADNDEPVGRKLNFLLQEMNREANTIGSKCNDANLTGLVVELKDELEKMREQVQNIE